MNGKTYDAKIVNMNNSVEKRKKDAYQIRYPRNGELSQALQQYFFKSMSYIKMIRENRDPKEMCIRDRLCTGNNITGKCEKYVVRI